MPRTPSVGNGRSEICWAVITPDDRFAFTTNYADGAVSRFAIASDGSLVARGCDGWHLVDGMPGLRDEDLSATGASSTRSTPTGAASTAGRSSRGLARAGRIVGRRADDGGGARGDLRPGRRKMRLEPLYTVSFTTPEAWSVQVTADAGIEGRGFLLAEGRSTGRLSARYRAANFP